MNRREFIEMIPVGTLGAHFLASRLYSQDQSPSAPTPEWNNPEVLDVNIERPHTTMTPFPDRKSALTGDRERSP